MKHETNHFESEDIPIDVLYEDADILIINKQPYVVVHPTRGHPTGTIANGLAKYFEDKGIYDKIRFINRLDRDTSGILLIAKNGFGQQAVSNQMRANKVKKLYTTVVKGHMECESGEISTPIGRPSEDSVKRDVLPIEMGGQSSLTLYRVVERLKDHDVLEVELITGRTHQIRVHLSSIGHPIVGDELYGGETDRLDRQALHCSEMVLKSARGSDTILVNAELPEDITKIIDELR
jgi:23S rRNA pseudouridine1911/1915/1917 synthase